MGIAPSTDLREAGSPKPARRRSRRPSATHVLIAVFVILAFVLNLLVLQDRSATTMVAIAERPLAVGAILQSDDVRLAPVDASFEGIASLVTEDQVSDYDGWVVARSVATDAALGIGDLAAPGADSGLRSMSLPVPIEHAAGGSLVSGDRVDVVSVVDGAARFIATGLEVISVSDAGAGAIGSGSAHHVVVAVEAEDALRLAEALEAGSMELLRSTGATELGEPTSD